MDELFAKAPIKKVYFKLALPVYFKLALPVVLGMITTMIYNLADTMFVAKTGDTNLVAGITIGAPLFTFLIAVSDIFGLGGSSLISRLFGERNYQLSKRVSSFCMIGGFVTGLIRKSDPSSFRSKSCHLSRCCRFLSCNINWRCANYLFNYSAKSNQNRRPSYSSNGCHNDRNHFSYHP